MNKSTYIKNLQTYLSGLTKDEQNDVIDFYSEYIEDANLQSDNEIIAKLGTAKQLARKVLADYSIKENEGLEEVKTSSSKSNIKLIWVILLGILSTPLTIPVAVLIFIGIVLVFGLLLTFIFAAILFFLFGIIFGAISIYSGIIFLFTNFTSGLFYLGTGLACVGLVLIICPLSISIIRFLLQITVQIFRQVFQKLSQRDPSLKGDN